MNTDSLFRVDGIKWWIRSAGNHRLLDPICPEHHIRLTPVITTYTLRNGIGGYTTHNHSENKSEKLRCEEDGKLFKLPRTYGDEKAYVINKKDAQVFAKMPTISLDDEIIPVAKEELKDTDYWVLAKVTESKSGTRLIIWAGSKKDKNKTQLFIEPELKRMSFDQNDDHPTEVFTKVEATFVNGIKTQIEKD